MDKIKIDNLDIWNPASQDAIVFNRFAGPSAIFCYENGDITVLKINEKYLDEIGQSMSKEKVLEENPWMHLDKEGKTSYEKAICEAIRTGDEVSCETLRIIFSELCGQEAIYIESKIRLLASEGEKFLLYALIRNVTKEKEAFEKISESERRFRYASEQINEYAWEYDIPSKEMRPCFRCMRDLGLPALVENYPEPAIEMGIFPEDYADLYRDWHKQLEEGVDKLEGIIPLTPERVPFHVRYTTAFDKNGNPIKAYGSAALVVDNEEKLKEALEEARRANASKTAFLSHMSHDIRTPLNGIIGLMEIDSHNENNIELLKKNRSKAKVAANHLLSLINDVLELSKLDDRNVNLVYAPFSIQKLADEVLTIAGMRAINAGVHLVHEDCSANFKCPYVIGSILHVRQILLNIFSNAIKYNVAGGSVSCGVSMEKITDSSVLYTCTVSDTGIGMSPEFLEHIFEPFSQEKNNARSRYQGTGLGMPIVKALLDKMNGTIDIASELGKGTTVKISIPFEIASGEDPDRSEEIENDVDITGANILIAEDNELNMEIATMLLQEAGCNITKAYNGEEAVRVYEEHLPGTFDMIFIDIMMPVMDGYSACKAIRSSGRQDAAAIPIIAMTANAFAEDVIKSREAGMNDHLSKPFNTNQLVQMIVKYLKK